MVINGMYRFVDWEKSKMWDKRYEIYKLFKMNSFFIVVKLNNGKIMFFIGLGIW